MGGDPALAGDAAQVSEKPGTKRVTTPSPAPRGITPEALDASIEMLTGIVRDLQSWSPGRHQFNPSLWQHIEQRSVVVLRNLRRLVEQHGHRP